MMKNTTKRHDSYHTIVFGRMPLDTAGTLDLGHVPMPVILTHLHVFELLRKYRRKLQSVIALSISASMKRILPAASNYADKDLFLAKALGLVNATHYKIMTYTVLFIFHGLIFRSNKAFMVESNRIKHS